MKTFKAKSEASQKPKPQGGASQLARVKRELEARQINKVKLGGFDIDGVFRGKYVSMEKFFGAAEGGLGFCDVVFGWDIADVLYDNAKVTGWHTGYPDAHATIDLSSMRFIPWEPGTAAFIMDFVNPDGSPLPASPRQLLQKMADRAEAMGLSPKFSAEFEYFIFKETAQSLRQKGFANLEPLSPGMFGYSWLRSSANAELVHALLDGCRAFDIPIEGMHTETGPGVYESAIQYDEVRRSADKAALFKNVVKELCARRDLTACFMAKWNEKLPGCSGHLHQSMVGLKDGKSRFFDAADAHGMSPTMRHYLGGLVKLMPELTAIYWPTVNAYKRSVENTWAPTTATWGYENRTTAIRIIQGGAKATRIEYRQTGADINPYLCMAANLAAGLWGIENHIEPPPPTQGNGYADSKAPPLPRNLRDAVRLLDGSKTARKILGDDFVNHYVATREWEVRQFERAVTNWELERYFELA